MVECAWNCEIRCAQLTSGLLYAKICSYGSFTFQYCSQVTTLCYNAHRLHAVVFPSNMVLAEYYPKIPSHSAAILLLDGHLSVTTDRARLATCHLCNDSTCTSQILDIRVRFKQTRTFHSHDSSASLHISLVSSRPH